jgi:hypothetical protein
MRRLIGLWLMADGIWTAIWFTGLVDSLQGRDMASVAAMVGRAIAAAISIVGGWSISQRQPRAPLAIPAAALIGAFSLIDAATGVLPSNLDPTFRWPAAWLQAAGAAVAILVLRRDARERM